MDPAAWRVAGIAGWMAVWWLSAVVPLEATALLPLVLLPITGIATIRDAAAPYADPVIFLFLGGFFVAATLERWDLHKRFALRAIGLVGTDGRRVILAFMMTSAFASMWISNTATAIMMLPIALAIVRPIGADSDAPVAVLLGIAYGASIGGVSTLIGTPPNAILAGAASELLGTEVSFAAWMGLALPLTVPMLIGCWLVLVHLFRVRGTLPGITEFLERERGALGPLRGGERFVLAVFGCTALAWIVRSPKELGSLHLPGLVDFIPGISDAGIAITAALILFATPLRSQRFATALDWDSAKAVPWGILLLFGGGLSLANAFAASGLTEWLGERLVGLRGVPLPVIVATTAALFVFLTELTSNTATAALGMPLMVGVAQGLGVAALPLMITTALAASMAFMLPVATPPNAIVFGSRRILPSQMARAGLWLNVLSVLLISLWIWLRFPTAL
jgi:sodium-dependent dicarboxylate transporter 2/3/5